VRVTVGGAGKKPGAMPRKWRQSDYDDDGYGDCDEEDYYDDEEYAEERPASSASVVGGEIFSSSLTFRFSGIQ